MYRKFWSCHKSVEDFYIAKNVEKHREEYVKGYTNLRIYDVSETITREELETIVEARVQKILERSSKPLHRIISEETKDVVSALKEMRKEEGTESAKKLFGDFVKDLQAEIENSIKDVQNQNRLALKELKALTKAVEKALN